MINSTQANYSMMQLENVEKTLTHTLTDLDVSFVREKYCTIRDSVQNK